MSATFRPAVREDVGLLIGLAGGTGSGKTYTGMRLASGISGGKPFAVIDTEARRALHYADQFKFDHCELKPPFRPKTYEDAILAADAAEYSVILVDSTSHVWSGAGGVLDWQEEELDELVRRAGQRGDRRPEWQIRESGKMAAWIKPKMAHKHMVNRLLQVRAHVILCFRAEEKVEMVKDDKGKLQIVPKQSRTGLDGWIPVCEKSLPFELTCSFLLTADAPGVPKPIKLQEQHRSLFPLDKPITEDSGKRLAQWASGATAPRAAQTPGPTTAGATSPPSGGDDRATQYITDMQAVELDALCSDYGVPVARLKAKAKVDLISQILASDFDGAKKWILAQAQTAKSE